MLWKCAGFGLAIAFTVKAFQTPIWTEFSRYSSWISVILGIAVVVDTILAAVLVVVLHRSRTGFEATNSLLDTLITYTVTTGALTDLFNILGFVFGPSNSPGIAPPIEGIEIKVEKRYTYTYTTESGRVVEIPDLERGEER
uniref:Atg26p n=1 Tax=Ganoderma boninense TaxID=34458 RepID=A0A5K1JSN3_9APHY|nr:Atg26p [Ganoderma boninense]